MIQKYIKRPVTIEAVQYTGDNADEIMSFVGLHLMLTENGHIIIPTLEGNMVAVPSDYIIKGVAGEFYPCKEDIFYKTYELRELISQPKRRPYGKL